MAFCRWLVLLGFLGNGSKVCGDWDWLFGADGWLCVVDMAVIQLASLERLNLKLCGGWGGGRCRPCPEY